MTTIEIPKEVVALSTDAENQITIAKGFIIQGQDDYQLAADQLKQIKNKGKALDEQRKKMTQPLDSAKKSIMDFFRTPGEFLAEAETIIKGAMLQYSKAEERRRIEEERKAQEEANRLAAIAKEKADKEAAEAKAQAEKDAELARSTGNDDIADMILEKAAEPVFIEPVITVPIPPPATAPKVQGASIRKTYSCEVVDKIALCRAIAEGKCQPRFMVPDMAALRNEATNAKDDFNMPGCKLLIVESVVSR